MIRKNDFEKDFSYFQREPLFIIETYIWLQVIRLQSFLTSVIYSLDFVIQPQNNSCNEINFFPKHSNDIQKSNGKAFFLTCISGFQQGGGIEGLFPWTTSGSVWRRWLSHRGRRCQMLQEAETMLLNTLECVASPQTKEYLAQSVNRPRMRIPDLCASVSFKECPI